MTIVATSAALAAAPRRAQAEGPRFETAQGVLVLLEEDHTFPLVSISVTARTGSAADPVGKDGLARLTAMLLRRGVRGRTSDEIDELVDGLGASMSVNLDYHSITIGGQVIRRSLEPFAELLSEMIRRPTLAADELERLKRETVAEIVNERDSDRDLAARHLRRFLFGDHPYARTPLGTAPGVRAVTRRDVVDLWRRVFVAQDLVLAVSGDITRADLEDLVGDHFSELRTGEPPEVRLPRPRAVSGRRVLIVDKPDRTQTQIYIGQLGVRAKSRDIYALTVANTVFGGTFTARLMKEVRSKRGWSYGAYSRLGRGVVRDLFTLWTFPAARDAVDCIKLELSMLESFVHDGITASELEFAKSYLENSYAFEVDTADKRLEKRIDEEVLHLGTGYYRRWLQHIREVDLEAANAAVRRHFETEDLSIVLVATASELRDKLAHDVPGIQGVETIRFDRD